jgi:hypothetical protein
MLMITVTEHVNYADDDNNYICDSNSEFNSDQIKATWKHFADIAIVNCV